MDSIESSRADASFPADVVRIGTIAIPRSELVLRFVRSSGPGGQNVNKVATKVELTFDVRASAALDEGVRARILTRLANRIDSRGVLHIASDRHRSQKRNVDDAIERFAALIASALVRPKRRVATRPTRASRQRRLDTKRKRGDKKASRRTPRGRDE